MSQSEFLVSSLLNTARRAVRGAEDELIRLKERVEQLRQQRMELEAIQDAMKVEAQAIEAQRAATGNTDAVADESAVPEGNAS